MKTETRILRMEAMIGLWDNILDLIAENRKLKREIKRLKAFPPVSVNANQLDLAMQCAELKAELEMERNKKAYCPNCGQEIDWSDAK